MSRYDEYWGPKPAYKYVRVRIIPETATQIAERPRAVSCLGATAHTGEGVAQTKGGLLG